MARAQCGNFPISIKEKHAAISQAEPDRTLVWVANGTRGIVLRAREVTSRVVFCQLRLSLGTTFRTTLPPSATETTDACNSLVRRLDGTTVPKPRISPDFCLAASGRGSSQNYKRGFAVLKVEGRFP